jgi:hypothetical protein
LQHAGVAEGGNYFISGTSTTQCDC